MKTTTLAVVAAFAVSALAAPTVAMPPGHFSITFEYVTASYFDFKDGVGIADPADENSPCTALLLGLRGIQPIAETWELDQNMGTNINGPAIGISNLVPPLTPAGGWLPNSGGVNLGVPCPIPGSGTTSLWLIWSGMNWRSIEADSSTQLTLCSQETFASSSPGCLASPIGARLWASACNWDKAVFGADYTDGKGKYLGGVPFDNLAGLHFKSDQIKCGTSNNQWKNTVDYTDTIQDFTAGGASQTFDIIKNEAVVHGEKKGVKTATEVQGDLLCETLTTPPTALFNQCEKSGTAYMAVCWDITYLDFQDPLNPVAGRALTHDWKLIIDLQSLTAKAIPGDLADITWQLRDIAAALVNHYGPGHASDQYIGGSPTALRGFYSQDSGNPKGTDFKGGTGVGENGFPCTGSASPPDAKKPPASI